jgi:hypothetical protein
MSTSLIWSLEYLTGRWQPTIGDPTIRNEFSFPPLIPAC